MEADVYDKGVQEGIICILAGVWLPACPTGTGDCVVALV